MGSCFLPHCLKTPIGGAPGTRCINHQPRHTEASAPSISYSCFHVSSKFSALHLKHSLKCKTVKTSMKSTSGICMEMAVEVAEKLKSKREKTTHLNFRNSSLLFFTFHWKYLAKGAGLTPQHLCAIMKPSARFHKTSTRSGITALSLGSPKNPQLVYWATGHNKPPLLPKQMVWPSQQCFQITHSKPNGRQHRTAMEEGANSLPAVPIYFTLLFQHRNSMKTCRADFSLPGETESHHSFYFCQKHPKFPLPKATAPQLS